MKLQSLSDRCVIVHGEALETLRSVIVDKSFDLVCTDPPYGSHTHSKLGTERRKDGGKVSVTPAFPPLDQEQITALAKEFVRICRGWILIFTDDRTIGSWGNALIDAGGAWVRTGYWIKTNPKPQMTADRPGTGAEAIVIGHAVGEKMRWHGGGRAAVWRGNRDLDDLHPNQKPLWLLQELLGLFADPEAKVIDPFMGSGTTGVASLISERVEGLLPPDLQCKPCAKKHVEYLDKRPPIHPDLSFLGIEGDESVFSVATNRLKGFIQ